MADKRNSVAGKIATPNLKVGGGSAKDVVDADSNLYKAVGSRYVLPLDAIPAVTMTKHRKTWGKLTPNSIKITCAPNNNVLEGTLFTACNLTNAIAINTAPAPPNPSAPLASQPGDFHIIPFAHIVSFEIVGSGERVAESAEGQRSEQGSPRAFRCHFKDVSTNDAHKYYERVQIDSIFSLPTRWADTQIVVNDAVLIKPPYTLDSIKAPADKAQSEAHVRKVVEHYYSRKKGASGGAPRAPVATPIAPRKGG
jgi:hypothetical protein